MTLPPVGLPGAVPPVATTPMTSGTGASAGSAFAQGLASVEQAQATADQLAGEVATGDVQDVHQFTVAATKANLAVELTAALRDRAVEAYQDIMRMQV